jgi:hypothetical protein
MDAISEDTPALDMWWIVQFMAVKLFEVKHQPAGNPVH